MADNKKHINYSAEDLQRYHKGTMSPAEMHALEKTAMDDPFLSDALEGYRFSNNAKNELDQVKARLTEKIAQRKMRVLPYSWLRIAALIIVIAGGSWLAYTLLQKQPDDIALSKEPNVIRQSDDNIQEKSPDTSTQLQTPVNGNASSDVALQPQKKEGLIKQKPILEVDQSKEVAAKEDGSITGIATERRADTSINQTMQLQTAPTANASNVFKGKVVDANNNPLPHANVIANNRAIQTDEKGYFAIASPDSVLNATVNAAGYESNKAVLKNSTEEQKIILSQSKDALQEVVVTAMGTRKNNKSLARQKMVTEESEPEEGWDAFDEYLASNLKPPPNIVKPADREVKLSFEIDKNGEPTNIKIEKSLCAECDAEAVRLLKEGPKWKRKKGKRAQVSIKF